ncbi:23S rRNA (adenine-N6)-dimethyltransferase [Spinactinospora alkalitolerans]|uniref:23S rRNA (Adenine-N6)-dimethyltransferase n=1 Tax=Spinactinospora alkalitolerans TaxID=687207 RepID=A0A852TXV9_9ACTN|nr:ErmE/ErmH/ErmO/ErmR family 23S rRNA (adenine(2058)-N(6))-methyltransferase [Spinactinospora alkalitolerans]NYE47653.1 23S rRNA (adenine-N6)-dimethyltransferase [Spinactinospora alkalitolerans]
MASNSKHRTSPSPEPRSTGRGRARRSLSQNLLTDPAVARWIVRTARIDPDGLVVEVGAGEGMLTRALAPACRRLLCYEIDPVFAANLTARHRDDPGVRIVRGDFLKAVPPDGPFSVVGNIPYAITSPIVDWCLRAPGLTSATLITQREYARKRTGGYGRWSRLTVQTWPRFDWRATGRIPRDRFRPVPGVDSAVLRIERRGSDLLPKKSLGAYRRLVDLGFTGVGGSLHASLRRRHPARRVDAAFRAAGLDPRVVVGFVPPDRWIALFTALEEPS